MAGRVKIENVGKRLKAYIRKAHGGVSLSFQPGTRDAADILGLIRIRRRMTPPVTLSQKGLRWLAALEREEG